jgi:hypothetical protein
MQEDLEFEASLGYTERLSQKKKPQRKMLAWLESASS